MAHTRVTYEKDGWYIQDLDSTNGTQVDGRSISKADYVLGLSLQLEIIRWFFVKLPKKTQKEPLLQVHDKIWQMALDEERHNISSNRARGQVLSMC